MLWKCHTAKAFVDFVLLRDLQYGGYDQLTVKNEQLAFLRATPEQQVYVALNLSEHPEYIEFRGRTSALVDLFTGTRFETNDGNFKLELPAYGARIFVEPHVYEQYVQQADLPAAAVSQPEPVRPEPRTLKIGRYRHFKGNEYEVVGCARHSETLEELVVYRALYGEQALWVRPLEMFLGDVERDGKPIPRFTWIG